MRIVLATGLFPPQIGGHAKYAKEIHDELVRRGHTTVVVAFGDTAKYPPILRHLVYFMRVFGALRGADFVLAFDTWSAGFPALIASKLRGVPLVARVGGDFLWESYIERGGELVPLSHFYTPERRLTLKERLIYRGTKFFIRHAHKLLFNSKWQRDIWLSAYYLPKDKIVIVENEFTAALTPQKPEGKIFVLAGRTMRLKNIERFEKAFVQVKQKHPEIELDTRPLPAPEHRARLTRAYAVVVPSISDMSPNAVWEGVALGKPFICTKESGAAERLHGLGIFVDPLSVEALKDAIESMLDPAVYGAYIKKIEEFSYTHSWAQITDEILTAI